VSVAGFIIVNKPAGVASFAMVRLMRRLIGVKRVGHAGTLDPLASGVLPVAVGQATRFIEYLDEDSKTYAARIRFGVTTDTYDAEGRVVRETDASKLTRNDVEAALSRFIGDIVQKPPAFSAIKLAGKPLYRYAREGVAVEAASRTVHIESIDLLSFAEAEAEVRVVCGKGTYIRSLAHDAGASLGCGGHLSALERTRSGGFEIANARTPDELSTLASEGRLDEALLAVDRAVERRAAAILGEAHEHDVRTGRDVRLEATGESELCRAYALDGAFLGVLESAGDGLWHPAKVAVSG
jgi:tRNA pseudouridine55 synthase